jgi:hypothetical protein
MDPQTRRRRLREYLWFASILVAVLIGAVIQQNGRSGMHSLDSASLNVGAAPH